MPLHLETKLILSIQPGVFLAIPIDDDATLTEAESVLCEKEAVELG
jgi:hypothetical protein